MKENHLELIQDVQKQILKDIHEFCESNNINYQIWGGTLIGAVRHKGFIPWDDDIDIIMLREDYDKFCGLFPDEGPSCYFLQNIKTEKEYEYNFAKVRKNNTLALEKDFYNKDMHQGIWIDIFPLDAIPNNSIKKAIFLNKVHILDRITTSQIIGNITFDNNFKNLFRNILLKLTSFRTKKYWIDKNSKTHLKYNKHLDVRYSALSWSGKRKEVIKYLLDKTIYSDSIIYEFEDIEVWGPRDFDIVLKKIYGDYLVPVPENQRLEGHSIIKFSLKTKNIRGV